MHIIAYGRVDFRSRYRRFETRADRSTAGTPAKNATRWGAHSGYDDRTESH